AAIGDLDLFGGVVLAAEDPTPRAADDLGHGEGQGRIGLVDEDAHGEDQVEPAIPEGQVAGGAPHGVHAGNATRQLGEGLLVDVDAEDVAWWEGAGDPL